MTEYFGSQSASGCDVTSWKRHMCEVRSITLASVGITRFDCSKRIRIINVLLLTSFCLMMLNVALSVLVLLEEIIVICLILPWIPAKKIGEIISFLRKWGFPEKLTLTLYIMMFIIFVVLNIIGLEFHYLEVNEGLRTNFNDFKNSLFTALKLFIVMHRLLHLLSNEASLRSTCYLLKKRLKIEQGEELDDKDLGVSKDEDLEINNLRGELERTRLDLEAMKEAYSRLQQKLEYVSGDPTYLNS